MRYPFERSETAALTADELNRSAEPEFSDRLRELGGELGCRLNMRPLEDDRERPLRRELAVYSSPAGELLVLLEAGSTLGEAAPEYTFIFPCAERGWRALGEVGYCREGELKEALAVEGERDILSFYCADIFIWKTGCTACPGTRSARSPRG